MISLQKYSRAGLVVALVAGVTLAMLLCVQCVRTYLYVDRVLVPQEVEREAERQGGAVATAARTASATDPRALSPLLERAMEEAADRIIWIRLVNQDGQILSQAGPALGDVKVPQRWFEAMEKRESLGRVVQTPRGKAMVAMVPFRMPRQVGPGWPDFGGRFGRGEGLGFGGDSGRGGDPGRGGGTDRKGPGGRGGGGGRAGALILEIALELDAVSEAFRELRHNLVSGVVAALALMAAMALIGFRTPSYLRGKYLDKEMSLARRVQGDLLPKAVSVSPYVEFAASAMAADQVGGDFLDVFESDAGRVSVVLGDVSGKGIPAALLASVTQGAIRSSSGTHPDVSCERINRMLCEKTASERFVTLFWGVFDPLTATFRYVNAGHSAPILQRANPAMRSAADRMDEGGPVLGVLPGARYSSGVVQIEAGDTLIVYSDGVNEAADLKEEEFGDDRVRKIAEEISAKPAQEICERIMGQVASFAAEGPLQDDRTLVVVRFLKSRTAMTA